jgi:hypothetical protein
VWAGAGLSALNISAEPDIIIAENSAMLPMLRGFH